ncbi:MAG: hypothetical protein HY614_03835 [Candidatus Rokubacteria bacterium]|nr:hypothetical protein [Candidatus Rokubacteria bacterium]
MRTLQAIGRGVLGAVHVRWKVFLAALGGVVAVNVLLPPLVLSIARKPVDYFTFNAWLHRLPEYLASAEVPLAKKAEFLPNLALFWFSSDNPYGVEWGFTVTVSDLARFLVLGALFGAYFALWAERRARPDGGRRGARSGGFVAAFSTVIGFSTGPCSVMGCGAPVIPVVGLAFAGLSSGTLAALAELSRAATSLVFTIMTLAVAYLGWRAGRRPA